MTACVYNEELANANNPDTEKQEITISYSIDTAINGSKAPDNQSIQRGNNMERWEWELRRSSNSFIC